MANLTFDQLQQDMGIIQSSPCSLQENQQYNEMLRNGEPLPNGISASPYRDANGNSIFYRVMSNAVPLGKEEQYVLMRISKDLHFIATLIRVNLVLGIIAAIILLFILTI